MFESAKGIAEMQDFVRRNDANCAGQAHACPTEYRYADIALQHDHYAAGFVGARDDGIVAAADAAVQVLQGQAAPAPFSIKSPREALLMLAHYAGDIHQPLHANDPRRNTGLALGY